MRSNTKDPSPSGVRSLTQFVPLKIHLLVSFVRELTLDMTGKASYKDKTEAAGDSHF